MCCFECCCGVRWNYDGSVGNRTRYLQVSAALVQFYVLCAFISVCFFLGPAILKTLFRIEDHLDDLTSEMSYPLNYSEFICSSVQFIPDLVCSMYFFKDDCTLPLQCRLLMFFTDVYVYQIGF